MIWKMWGHRRHHMKSTATRVAQKNPNRTYIKERWTAWSGWLENNMFRSAKWKLEKQPRSPGIVCKWCLALGINASQGFINPSNMKDHPGDTFRATSQVRSTAHVDVAACT